jgi:hypothetical protein
MPGKNPTAPEILAAVKKVYTGARGNFVMSRLCLRTNTNLAGLSGQDARPDLAEKLAQAVREICPDVDI